MSEDDREYLRGRIAGLGFAIAALIDHLAKKDPALRREMADRFRELARDVEEMRGAQKALEAIARQIDGFAKSAGESRPRLRLFEKETDQDN